jgi:arginyl-tRNA synthetase
LGRVILLDDLIKEAAEKVKEKFKVDDKIAKAIGIGAVTYFILKVEAKKQVMFKWEDVLSLEGNSGPYVQYAYARCCSILSKAGRYKEQFSVKILTEYEKRLLKTLIIFGDVIKQAAVELRPDVLCSYVYDLATRFNTFYQFCSVLNAEAEELKNFRLTLVDSVKTVLGIVLNLLNIERVERV